MDLLLLIVSFVIKWSLITGVIISFGRIVFWHFIQIKLKIAKKYGSIVAIPLLIHPVIFFLWPRKYAIGYKKDFGGLSYLPLLPYSYNKFYFTNASAINFALINKREDYIFKRHKSFNYQRDNRSLNPVEFLMKQIALALIYIPINPIIWIIWFPVSAVKYYVMLRSILIDKEDMVVSE